MVNNKWNFKRRHFKQNKYLPDIIGTASMRAAALLCGLIQSADNTGRRNGDSCESGNWNESPSSSYKLQGILLRFLVVRKAWNSRMKTDALLQMPIESLKGG